MKNSFLLFMFGSWKILENEENTFNHIKELFQTVTNEDEITFITGENLLIANINSEFSIEDIHSLFVDTVNPEIVAYFIIPNPQNVKYRLNPMLESQLFGKHPENTIKSFVELFQKELIKNLQKLSNDISTKNIIVNSTHTTHSIKEVEENSLELDDILDKIHAHGIHSLNDKELNFLNSQSKIN
jgi:hypothetical protein